MGEYMRENTLHYPSSGLCWNGEVYGRSIAFRSIYIGYVMSEGRSKELHMICRDR